MNQLAYYQPLEFLIYTTIVFIVVIGIFLIKLLYDVISLMKCFKDFARIINTELEPTLKELQTTLININNISSNVNSQLNGLNDGIRKSTRYLSDLAVVIGCKAKTAGEVVGKNILSGLYLLTNSIKNK